MAKSSSSKASQILPPGTARTWTVATIFFFSGAIALVYEVVWQRQFALLLGSAAPATAAVLSAYFAGMGAGSLIIGRRADRWTNPLRAYAILELLVALGATTPAAVLPAVETIYPWLYAKLSGVGSAFFLVKLLIAFAAVAPPAFCMGGTLPVLGRFVDRSRHRLGITAGLLYATNTAGASLGALAMPFVLLPLLGIFGASMFCVAGNVLLAAWAWQMSKQNLIAVPQKARSAKSTFSKAIGKSSKDLYALALISGVVTFALQVLWNRAFAQVHENAIHSFAVIVSVVIFSLAIGAQLARIGLRHGLRPRRLLAASWLGAGLAITAGPALFIWLTDDLSYISRNAGWFDNAGRLLGIAAAVLLVPVTLMGVALPVIMEESGKSSDLGTSDLLGRILLANIVGSVAGALLAGFALPKLIPLWRGILLAGGLLTVVGGVLLADAKHRWRPGKWMPATFAGVAVLGIFISRTNLPRVRIESNEGEQVLSIAEGTHGITAVTERAGSRRLKLNNHYLLGGTASTGDERMQAHIPLLLHPDPRNVAFLGLGTGITAGGALFHPVKRLTAIELVPEVVTAARRQFADANAGVVDDPRTRIVLDDARNFLRGSREKFDVIIGDLVVPWRQGEGALFTAESFSAARDSLAPGGLFCQWVPCFQLSESEFRIVLRTFLTVFPQAMLWRGDFSPTEPAIALIGCEGSFNIREDEIKRRLSEMKPDRTNAHLVRPPIFWMYYLGTIQRDNAIVGAGPLNTDNRPVIELLGPLEGRDGETKMLTGRHLQRFLKTLFGPGQPTLSRPDSDEGTGRKVGVAFEEMMLQIFEGNAAGARASQAAIRLLLTAAEYKLLFP